MFSSEPLQVNGTRTLEENFADLNGIAAAYNALVGWRAENAQLPNAIPGLTDEQLFFVAYGQLSCQVMNEGGQIAAAYFGEHAPGRFRVNGPLSQFPPFRRAFACTASSPMVADPVCAVFGAKSE